MPKYRPIAERFHEKYEAEPSTGCWLWTAGLDTHGYGHISAGVGRQIMRAHRVSWELHRGPIPDGPGFHGTCVLHRCDVRRCVNPDHLFLGTNADNAADMIAKGRKNPARGDRHGSVTRPDRVPRGERHGRSKLTETNVREIRTLRAGGRSMRSLAREFGVTRQSIQAIIRRKTWKHV